MNRSIVLFCTLISVARCCFASTARCSSQLSASTVLTVTSPITCTSSLTSCSCETGPQQFNITVHVTVPQSCSSKLLPEQNSGATVFFYNGFGGKPILTAADYAPYAAILAAAGYSTVQYDVNQLLAMVPDLEELTFLLQVYDWLDRERQQHNSALSGVPDLSNVAVAGHSRGGKLAALQFANGTLPNTFAAFLVDPVDNPCFAPTPECYPPARVALSKAGKPIGAVGSTIRYCCNPNTPAPGQKPACPFCTGYGAEDLVRAAGHGSELYPRAAGHMQFAQLPVWEQGAANLACHANASVTSLEVIQDVGTLMVSWFDRELARANPGSAQK